MNSLSTYYQPLELIAWQFRQNNAPTVTTLNIFIQDSDGRCDRLLWAMLDAIGYSTQNVQRINASQIENLTSGLLLIFGEKSAQHLLNSTQSLDALRGQIHLHGKNNLSVIVTYHPIDLLQNPMHKKNAYSDLLLTHQALATPL